MNDEQLDALRADLYQMACEAGDRGKNDYAHGLFVAIYMLDEQRCGLRRPIASQPVCGVTCVCGSPCAAWRPADV